MSMSLFIVQPLIEAGKKGFEASGVLNSSNEGASQFQSLLDRKMSQSAAERQKPAEPQGSSASAAARSGEGDTVAVTAMSGEFDSRTKYLLETIQLQGEQDFVPEDDALLLSQLMALAAGAQIIPVEPSPGNDTVELADDASRLLFSGTDGGAGRPLLARVATSEEAAAPKVTDDSVDFVANPGTGTLRESTAADATDSAVGRGAEVTADRSASQPQQTPAPVAATQAPGAAGTQTDAAAVPPAVRIMQSVGSPEWSQAVGQRILWMVGQEQQSASLMLNPPDLGPVRIVLSISNNQATANFFSAHPDVRTALEGSLPRLREMLEGAGVELGQTHVGGEDQGNQQGDSPSQPRGPFAWGADPESEQAPVAQEVTRTVTRGLIDTFA